MECSWVEYRHLAIRKLDKKHNIFFALQTLEKWMFASSPINIFIIYDTVNKEVSK